MQNNFIKMYIQAFFELLFVRLYPSNINYFGTISKGILYISALTFFYLPIFYFAINKCLFDNNLIFYFIMILLIHITAKFMLCNSKRIQLRFSTIKAKDHFLIRTWLIIEYLVFMWLVYLFYPLSCILAPLSLLSMFIENNLGYTYIYDLFLQNQEHFIYIGAIISYILFIITDGYKKLKSGFLPDYLALYAVLTFVSSSTKGTVQKFFNYLSLDTSNITEIISQIFLLSNSSMNIVASVVMFVFAIYSLYTRYEANDTKPPDAKTNISTE